MPWTREQLISRTLTRIDESGGQAAVLGSVPVGQELDDAARVVLSASPPSHLFLISRRIVDPAYVKYDGTDPLSVIMPLPADYLRLMRIALHNWARPVDTLIEIGTPAYDRQAYDYDRARPGNPVAAVIPFYTSGAVQRAIECFPAPKSLQPYDIIQTAGVAPEDGITQVGSVGPATSGMPRVRNTETMGNLPPLVTDCLIVPILPAENVPDALVDAMVWLAAERCLTSLRVQEGAKNCQAHFKEALSALGATNG